MKQNLALANYMKLHYKVEIKQVTVDGEDYYQARIPKLPNLEVYVKDKAEIPAELTAAKREWFAAQMQHNQPIPSP